MRYIFLLSLFCFSLAAEARWKVCLLVYNYSKGEMEFAERLKIAGGRLNWDMKISHPESNFQEEEFDFVLNMARKALYHPTAKNYLVIFDPNVSLLNENSLKEEARGFDGYLCTINNLDAKPNMKWYPTVQNTPYQQNALNKLCYICNPELFRKKKFLTIFSYLDRKNSCVFYGNAGPINLYERFPNSYQGFIPVDGMTLLKTLQESGIVLLMHRPAHLSSGIPSGRIFEAAAASTVIISDKNSFVMEHFGDSVLYVDQEAKTKTVYEQIDTHLKWIEKNPNRALRKAKRAHEIFQEKFLLEDQLLRLEQWHLKVCKNLA